MNNATAIKQLRSSRDQLDRERQRISELIESYDRVLEDLGAGSNGVAAVTVPTQAPAKPPPAKRTPPKRRSPTATTGSSKQRVDTACELIAEHGPMRSTELVDRLAQKGVELPAKTGRQAVNAALRADERFEFKGGSRYGKWHLVNQTEQPEPEQQDNADPIEKLLGHDRILVMAYDILDNNSPLHAGEIHDRFLQREVDLGGITDVAIARRVAEELGKAPTVFHDLGNNSWGLRGDG